MPSLHWVWQHRRGPQQLNKKGSVLPQGLAIAHDEHGTQLPWIASRGAPEARLFPVSRATRILKSRHCWRLADIAMRDMQCQLFLSAWYYSHQLVGQSPRMKEPLTGTMIWVPETGPEIDTESGPHGAVTHSA
jgi:hypothetical protein